MIAIGLRNRAPDDVDPRRINDWRQTAIDFVRPVARTRVDEVEAQFGDTRSTVVLVEVPRSEAVHATTSDDVYLRVGDEDRRLTYEQRRELLYDKGLVARSLISPPRGVRVAALVAFGGSPSQWLPQHLVRVVRY